MGHHMVTIWYKKYLLKYEVLGSFRHLVHYVVKLVGMVGFFFWNRDPRKNTQETCFSPPHNGENPERREKLPHTVLINNCFTTCFAFSVLFPVLARVLVLGTSPVLQPNDPLWSSMWGREEGGRERKRRGGDEEREWIISFE